MSLKTSAYRDVTSIHKFLSKCLVNFLNDSIRNGIAILYDPSLDSPAYY